MVSSGWICFIFLLRMVSRLGLAEFTLTWYRFCYCSCVIYIDGDMNLIISDCNN